MDDPTFTFWLGFVVGAVTLGIVGRIVSQILWHLGRPFRPQAIQTDETPWEVVTGSCCSAISGVIVIIALVLLALFIIGVLPITRV